MNLNGILFSLGLKSADTILAPIAKIVDDLTALAAHQSSEIAVIGIRQQQLTQRKRQLQYATNETQSAIERVSKLLA
ncbi:hypothetical protein UFOVP823_48 [uncultured Caudovirales phage]|uniref:Uncharacterized protein n=1 Tax=uncultured Caudovirales phage TaxID=2100421 RepID=A0A6J5P2A2_9CAUD|nr:hypothetical protein UFOVP823_48 [uncultured Caudovirales phage]